MTFYWGILYLQMKISGSDNKIKYSAKFSMAYKFLYIFKLVWKIAKVYQIWYRSEKKNVDPISQNIVMKTKVRKLNCNQFLLAWNKIP